MIHEHSELLNPVLHWSAAHQQRVTGSWQPLSYGSCPLGARILDVVRLVDNQRGDIDIGPVKCSKRAEGRQCHAAMTRPILESAVSVRPMKTRNPFQSGVPCDFVLPVRQHTGGADHKEVRRSLRAKVTKHRQGLDGLAQAHLVTEDRACLDERELGAEGLVPA